MGKQRYAVEFKDEGDRQVTVRGHSVVEVAARLGVASHNLYKWVTDVRPSKPEQRSDELGVQLNVGVLGREPAASKVDQSDDDATEAHATE